MIALLPKCGTMPTIEISEATLEALRGSVKDFNESHDTVLRRILGLGVTGERMGGSTNTLIEDAGLRQLISSSRFQHQNSRLRYLDILRFLHDRNPADFQKLLSLRFGKRVQIAVDRETIEKSGKSTYPISLPGTEYWILSNLSNRSKRDVVFAAMRILGWGEPDIRLAVHGIPDTVAERSSHAGSGS